METHLSAFWHSVEPDVQQVIKAMDSHESLGHSPENNLSIELQNLISQYYDRIEDIAEGLRQEGEDREQHIEVLLLTLAYAPNADSFSFVSRLVVEQPDIYKHIFSRVVEQKPLQMSGKLLKSRIMFYMEMQQIIQIIYSPETLWYVTQTLETFTRD